MRAILLAAMLGCSQAPSSPNSGEFQTMPMETVTSDSGRLVATVFLQSAEPIRGVNTIKLHVTDTSGHALDGIAMTVVPWMPSHAHGTSVIPIVEAMGGGDYVLGELDLFMPGRWQIRVSVTAPMNDAITPVLDVP